MAFTFSDEDTATMFGLGTLSLGAPGPNCAAGDLIVILVAAFGTGISIDSVSDDAGNTYTVESIEGPWDDGVVTFQFAYCLNSLAENNNRIFVDFNGDAGIRKVMIAAIFTPDSGETVTLDVVEGEANGFENSPFETAGGISTTGTDEVCVGGISFGVNVISQEIPIGTAATALTSADSVLAGCYRILSATESGIDYEVNADGGSNHGIGLICFKSVAAAGLSIPVAMHHLTKNIAAGR